MPIARHRPRRFHSRFHSPAVTSYDRATLSVSITLSTFKSADYESYAAPCSLFSSCCLFFSSSFLSFFLFFFLLLSSSSSSSFFFFIARSTRTATSSRPVTRRRAVLVARRNFSRFSRRLSRKKKEEEEERRKGTKEGKGKTDPDFSMFSRDRISRHLSRHQSRLGGDLALERDFYRSTAEECSLEKGWSIVLDRRWPTRAARAHVSHFAKLFNRPNVSVNETLAVPSSSNRTT